MSYHMSLSPRRVEGWNSAVVRSLHEGLRHRLACLFQAGSGGKLEDFRMIERVFDTDRLGLGGSRRSGRVGRRFGLGSGGLRLRSGWNRRHLCQHGCVVVRVVMCNACYRDGSHGGDADYSQRMQRKTPEGLTDHCGADIRSVTFSSRAPGFCLGGRRGRPFGRRRLDHSRGGAYSWFDRCGRRCRG